MWGGYPGRVGPTISRPGKRHQRVISWRIGDSQAHQPTLPRLSKSSPQSIVPEPQPFSKPTCSFLRAQLLVFPRGKRLAKQGALATAVLLCSPLPRSFIFTNIIFLYKKIKVLGARGGVLLVFDSLSSTVVSPNGLNKYTRSHRTQGTAFHLAFKRMTKPGLVK